MSYFIPSFLQKRLLRYTLSQLGILDTDALSLDNLDITWGKRSTVELKQVGIHHGKVASLLRLPDNCSLSKVKIERLRLTVPADLHYSGISVELVGLRIQVDVSLIDTQVSQSRQESGERKSKPQDAGYQSTASGKSEQPEARNAGASELPQAAFGSSKDTNTVIHNVSDTQELANSFLRSESSQEKRVLHDAMFKSQSLDTSLSSDTSQDLGVGEDPSLPVFLADFLNGIIERAELFVEDIWVDLILHFELSDGQVEQQQEPSRAENMTLRLVIDKAHIGGKQKRDISGYDSSDQGSDFRCSTWARRISISNLRLTILHSPLMVSRLVGDSHTASSQCSPIMGLHPEKQTAAPIRAEVPMVWTPTMASADSQHATRPADIASVGNDLLGTSLAKEHTSVKTSLSENDEHSVENPSILLRSNEIHGTQESTTNSDLFEDTLSYTQRTSVHAPLDSNPTTTSAADGQSLSLTDIWRAASGKDDVSQELNLSNSPPRQDWSHDSGTEDLTQSRLYSHDEAMSMYASALQPDRDVSSDDEVLMPGAWKSNVTYAEASRLVNPHAYSIADGSHPNFPSKTSHLSGIPSPPAQGKSLASHENELPRSTPDLLSSVSSISPGDKATRSPSNENELSHEEFAQGSQAYNPASGDPFIAKPLFECANITISLPLDTAEKASGNSPSANKQRHASVATDQGSKQQVLGILDFHADLINIYGDMTTTRLLLLVLQKGQLYSTRAGDTGDTKPDRLIYSVNLDIEHISWAFSTSIKEVEPRDGSFLGDLRLKHKQSATSGAMLSAELFNVKASHSVSLTSSISKIAVKNLTLSDAIDTIISLKCGLSTPVSVKNTRAATNDDGILITIQRGAPGSEAASMDVKMLPVKMTLDLQRLDDLFNCFGGLSTVLEVGSSMVSTVTPSETTPQMSPVMRRRAVHFEPVNKPFVPSEPPGPTSDKANIRIGGFDLEIRGKTAALHVESTAVKVIKRPSVVAVQCDQIKLKGPSPRDFREQDMPSIEVRNVRVEYLTVPQAEHLLQLIDLVTPSKLQAEDQFNDSLIVDTLMQQRKKGALVRITVQHIVVNIVDVACVKHVVSFITDFKKILTMASYLPEDNRPGLLISTLVKTLEIKVKVSERFGVARLTIRSWQGAFVTFPLLIALGVQTMSLYRNEDEEIVETSFPHSKPPQSDLPVFLARYIGNEMEPVIRVRLHTLRFEYQVSLLAVLYDLDLAQLASSDAASTKGASSVATAAERAADVIASSIVSPSKKSDPVSSSKITSLPKVDIAIKDIYLGLQAKDDPSKGYLVINRSQIGATINDSFKLVTVSVEKASFLIRDKDNLPQDHHTSTSGDGESSLHQLGYVFIGNLLAPKIELRISEVRRGGPETTVVNMDGGLLLLETCADSTQTINKLLTRLSPQRPMSDDLKYRTETIPINDMLASFTGHTVTVNAATGSDHSFGDSEKGKHVPRDQGLIGVDEPEIDSEAEDIMTSQILTQSMLEEDFEDLAVTAVPETATSNVVRSEDDEEFAEQGDSPLVFHDQYFDNPTSTQDPADTKAQSFDFSPTRILINNFHVICNLFDGYDWHQTRDRISQAITDVQKKAIERNAGSRDPLARNSLDTSEDVIGDFLFNSIYIGIPAQADPNDLIRHVDEEFDENSSGITGLTTSTKADSLRHRNSARASRRKAVSLKRSRHHKMTFELKGVACEAEFHSPASDRVMSVDVKVQDLEIFDHLPSSTWKKFATYMKDAGERESDSHMVEIHLQNLRPIPDLAATEFNVKMSVLPLRLHVDQDALDFLSRFFEFKEDQAVESSQKTEAPFIQRAEVKPIRIKLDFKPKRVDYAGLRSGRTSEFMNFFVLDRAELVLRHVILYGVSGFDRLGQTLNDIWTPDVKQNQLPGVLAGVGPIRSLVGVGEGVRDLFVVPIREYQKDGRIVRSFQKGALTFAKTTTGELVKLGARLAIGTQTMLQGAEEFLVASEGHDQKGISEGWDQTELDQDDKEVISLYSNQPIGILQGLRGGFANLERDLLTTKDVVIAMPGEIMESKSAGGVAKVVMKRAPTIILRPAAGMSKAVGQTLLGATNSLDPANRRRIEDKYKRH